MRAATSSVSSSDNNDAAALADIVGGGGASVRRYPIDRDDQDEAEEITQGLSQRRRRKEWRRCMICAFLLLFLLVGDAVVLALFDKPPCPSIGNGKDHFSFVGCYEIEPEQANSNSKPLAVTDCSLENNAYRCYQQCSSNATDFFAILEASSHCICLDKPPNMTKLLSFGHCSTSNRNKNRLHSMSVFYQTDYMKANNNDCSTEVKNMWQQLVHGASSSSFGWDVIHNQPTPSVFSTVADADACGGIYKVTALNPALVDSITSTQLQTTLQTVRDYADTLQTNLASSSTFLTTSENSSATIISMASVAASVLVPQNKELGAIFQNALGSWNNSWVLRTVGVNPILHVELAVDFDQSKYFITFDDAFGRALQGYQECLQNRNCSVRDVARNLTTNYGQFTLEKGNFGGYVQYLATFYHSRPLSRDYEMSLRDCFETSVVADGGAADFTTAEVGVSMASCHQDPLMQEILSSKIAFSSELGIPVMNGGHIEGNKFIVDPQDAVPLNGAGNFYSGVQFRLLSDLLQPEKISPVEKYRLQITDAEWNAMRSSLQNEIFEYLSEAQNASCTCQSNSSLPYVENGRCNCFPCQAVCVEMVASQGGNNPFEFEQVTGHNEECLDIFKIQSVSAEWANQSTIMEVLEIVYDRIDGSFKKQVGGPGGSGGTSGQVDFPGSTYLKNVTIYQKGNFVVGLVLNRSDGQTTTLGAATGTASAYQPSHGAIKTMPMRNNTNSGVRGLGVQYRLDVCCSSDDSPVVVGQVQGVEDNADNCWEADPVDHNLYMRLCDVKLASQQFEFYPSSGEIKQDDLCVEYGPVYSNVYLSECTSGDNQAWLCNMTEGTFATRLDGKCLDMSLDRNLYMNEYNGQISQRFLVLPTSTLCRAQQHV